jgi:cell division protein DivIC
MPVRSRVFDPRTVRAEPRRGSGGDHWQRLLRFGYFLVLLVMLALAGAVYWPVIQRHQSLEEKKQTIAREIDEGRKRTLLLQEELDALWSDPYFIERMARDLLNFGRPGETIYRFPPYEPVPSYMAPPAAVPKPRPPGN